MIGLIIIGYHKKNSFCHQGIVKTIVDEYNFRKKEIKVIDLYDDDFNPSYQIKNKELILRYQNDIQRSTHIYFVTPCWWFRCTSMLEGFFDQVLTPGFAYRFVSITSTYGLPKPLLSDKKVIAYITHGAPALPVLTIYLNSVKLRLQLGVFSFVFGWFGPKINQFFSVPFCSHNKILKYIKKVKKDVSSQIDDWNSENWLHNLM